MALLDSHGACLDHLPRMQRARASIGTRVEQRFGRRLRVNVRCRVHDGRIERYAWITDFGSGGARVLTAAPPPIGRKIHLSFTREADGAVIETQATVVWRAAGYWGRGGVMGVAFSASSMSELVERLRHKK